MISHEKCEFSIICFYLQQRRMGETKQSTLGNRCKSNTEEEEDRERFRHTRSQWRSAWLQFVRHQDASRWSSSRQWWFQEKNSHLLNEQVARLGSQPNLLRWTKQRWEMQDCPRNRRFSQDFIDSDWLRRVRRGANQKLIGEQLIENSSCQVNWRKRLETLKRFPHSQIEKILLSRFVEEEKKEVSWQKNKQKN